MVGRTFFNVFLFLSSFAPLFIALAVRWSAPPLRFSCLALALVGTLALAWLVFIGSRARSAYTVTLTRASDQGPDVSGYLAAYILPLVVISDPTPRDLVAFGIIMATAAVVYINSRMLQINPTLYLMNRRVNQVTSNDGFHGVLISRREVIPGDSLRVVRRGNLLFEVPD